MRGNRRRPLQRCARMKVATGLRWNGRDARAQAGWPRRSCRRRHPTLYVQLRRSARAHHSGLSPLSLAACVNASTHVREARDAHALAAARAVGLVGDSSNGGAYRQDAALVNMNREGAVAMGPIPELRKASHGFRDAFHGDRHRIEQSAELRLEFSFVRIRDTALASLLRPR